MGFTRYWNLFLIPPPLCDKLSHVLIDQCEEDVILDRNIDPRSSKLNCSYPLSRYGIDTRDNVKFDVCFGLAFATGFPALFFPILST